MNTNTNQDKETNRDYDKDKNTNYDKDTDNCVVGTGVVVSSIACLLSDTHQYNTDTNQDQAM